MGSATKGPEQGPERLEMVGETIMEVLHCKYSSGGHDSQQSFELRNITSDQGFPLGTGPAFELCL